MQLFQLKSWGQKFLPVSRATCMVLRRRKLILNVVKSLVYFYRHVLFLRHFDDGLPFKTSGHPQQYRSLPKPGLNLSRLETNSEAAYLDILNTLLGGNPPF